MSLTDIASGIGTLATDATKAARAGAKTAGTTPPAPVPATAPAPASTPAPTTPTAQQQADTANQQSASAQIQAFLASVPGLAQLDPTGALSAWMMSQVSTLAGQNIDSSTIVNTIENTMNNPNNDPTAKAVFDALFPGYNQKIANGTTNADGSYTGIAGYIAYASQIQQFAQTTNLVPGTITAQDIGAFWAGNVSTAEVSDRITSEVSNAAAALANPTISSYLASTWNIGQGELTSYYLNPTNTMATLNAVNSGIAGEQTGFGAMSQAQSSALSAFLAQPSSNGLSQVSTQQAENALTSNIAPGTSGAAQMAAAGFESALPGQAANGPGVTSADTLLGAVEGNQVAGLAVQRAAATRAASSGGGGGFVTDQQGAAGIGFGSQQ